MFPLTTTHLRFICEATTRLQLEIETYRAGQNLRGALGQVMTRSYCAGDRNDPTHVAICPVHWLLAANEHPGEERRGYAIVPPIPPGRDASLIRLEQDASPIRLEQDASPIRLEQDASPIRLEQERDAPPGRFYHEPGQRFEFGITLFGDALKFLPYFVLAVPEMGRLGVGLGRGKFALKSVWAENPLTRKRECLLAENDHLVHTPTLTLTHAEVAQVARSKWRLANSELQVAVDFLTPTRLIDEGKLAQAPAFDALFARLLKRLDDLAEQHANGNGRPREEIDALENLAARVRLVDTQTRWVEVRSGSSRSGRATWLSGIVGRAVYAAERDVWRELLPWLLWGQLVQIGKDTVKGNGVIAILDL